MTLQLNTIGRTKVLTADPFGASPPSGVEGLIGVYESGTGADLYGYHTGRWKHLSGPRPDESPRYGRGNNQFSDIYYRRTGADVGAFAESARWRIPGTVITNAGTELQFAQGLTSITDGNSRRICVRRREKDSKHFGRVIIAARSGGGVQFGQPCPLVDRVTGTIYLFCWQTPTTIYLTQSTDDGHSWSTLVDHSAALVVTDGSTPAGHTFLSNAWSEAYPSPCNGIVLKYGANAGRMVFPAYHRITQGALRAYPHVFIRETNGTIRLGGGPAQDEGELQINLIEPCIFERMDGTIVMIAAKNGSNKGRWMMTSADGGDTWTDAVTVAELAGVAEQQSFALRVSETSDTILFCGPVSVAAGLGTQARRGMTAFVSEDGGATWPYSKRFYHRYCAYITGALLRPDRVVLAFEAGLTGDGNAEQSWAEKIKRVEISPSWVISGGRPDVFLWPFNERAAGYAVASDTAHTGGQVASLVDWGGLQEHGRALASTLTYRDNGRGGVGVYFPGTSNAMVQVSPAEMTALRFETNDSFTIEGAFKTTADGTLFSTGHNSRRTTLGVVAGKLSGFISDSVNDTTVASAAGVDDGLLHRFGFVRNKTTGSVKLYLDGVEVDSETDATTTTLGNTNTVTVGGHPNNTSLFTGLIDFIRVERAALPIAALQPMDYAKPQPLRTPRYHANPTALGSCTLWIPPPAVVPEAISQHFQRIDRLSLEPGEPIASIENVANPSRVFTGEGINRAPVLAWKDSLGMCYRFGNTSSTGFSDLVPSTNAAITDFDHLHNDAIFTIVLYLELANLTDLHTIWDLNNGTGVNNGSFLSVNATTGRPYFDLTANGSARVSNTWTSPVFAALTPYQLALTCLGDANVVNLYLTALTAASVGSATASSSAVAGDDGTYNSTQVLSIGLRTASDIRALDGWLRSLAIHRRAFTQAELTADMNATQNAIARERALYSGR